MYRFVEKLQPKCYSKNNGKIVGCITILFITLFFASCFYVGGGKENVGGGKENSHTKTYPGTVFNNLTGNKVIIGYKRVITNSTDSPLRVYFSNLPVNDSMFLQQYILPYCTNLADIELTKWQVVNAIAHFLKSDRFVNKQLIYNNSYSDYTLWGREMSLVNFIYSTYSTQCGDYANHATTICMLFSDYIGGGIFRKAISRMSVFRAIRWS